ncbi:N-acetylmuramoyl-L-alanine amidase [Lipingzhangella sp. LS1_29]|uniref:N-acetylmuramoyl-L-alanine amidase n=1 Tax=Lipingzhangella rawalii TaxID=2055835 RepID=A0ABU2H999_9ACTN|nr:N-acetylmuramoyl-L-alanine amidase [Lipingzhangella rawalii]MDS1271882.1 N-acetylmuramoyl-L-alanine amidase [Lipingzhangella rawalii]
MLSRTRLRHRRVAHGVVVTVAALALTACGAASDVDAFPGGTDDADSTATLPRPEPDAPTAEAPDALSAESEGPLSGTTIVVDPGHNGGNADAPEQINREVDAGPETKACNTVGAATSDGYPEHEFTFELAQQVAEELRDSGAEVVLTREDNDGVGPCINERAAIANDADAELMLSLHADGGPPTGRGFHVIAPELLPDYTEDIAGPSLDFAESLRDAFRDGTDMPVADYVGSEGIDVRGDLGGLNLSEIPAVFLEAGNMRNAEDAELLTNESWRADAATAIDTAIRNHL